jgi:hypothetical protein
MTKQEFLKETSLTENQFLGIDKIGGSLYLSNVTSIPEGFNPTVGGSLYLNNVTSIPEGFNPTVGGSLYLENVTSIPEGFNPTVGGYLDLRSVTSIPEGFNPTVGGYLDLRSVTSIPEGFNPTVGGYLYLDNVTSIPEGFNPTVGGDLYLRSVTSIPKGFNPTVGGYLNLRNGLKSKYIKLEGPIFWGDKYVKADGIFTEIISSKGNIYKVKKLNDSKEFYLITDGNGKWSHGDTLQEAKEDLIFKITNRSKEDYKDLSLESILTFEKGIECYRVVTGACSFGTKDFVKSYNIEPKDYSIKEIIELTKGKYGNEAFKQFFNIK